MPRFWPTTTSDRLLSRFAHISCSRRFGLALALPCAFLLSHLLIPRASADVGVVLNESLDEDFDRISSTGHSAIYFSRICPESPVKRPTHLSSMI